MFRTSNLILAGAVSLMATYSAHAQSAKADDLLAGFLSDTGQGAAATATPSDELRAAITRKIMEIATTSNKVASAERNQVTIAELDELNRTAERAKTELELERLELERMKTELESLLALYDAVQTLEKTEEKEPGTMSPEDYMAMQGAQLEKQKAAEPTDFEIENAKLPRVAGIAGVAGNYSAEIVSGDGTAREAGKGDFLEDGFDVVEVRGDHVVLKGHMTGTQYRLAPRGEPRPVEGGTDGMSQAVDLGKMPIGIF